MTNYKPKYENKEIPTIRELTSKDIEYLNSPEVRGCFPAEIGNDPIAAYTPCRKQSMQAARSYRSIIKQ